MPNSDQQTFLCFDFGLKRIGVAVGQRLTQTATPLPHLLAKEGIPCWDDIAKLINEWQPTALVVGIPLQLDDSEQLMTHCARKFANRLKEKFKLKVYGIDERLTTREARNELFAEGGYRALKKGEIDSMAAKLMLEDWLRGN